MPEFVASMFALGLITSVHCVSMCGPLIVAYAVAGSSDGPWYRRLAPNAAYHVARFASYALLGLLLGALGSVFDFGAVRPYALFLAGGLMVVLALGMTGRVRWAQSMTPRPPKFLVEAIRKLRHQSTADATADSPSLATPLVLGFLTGALPCGPAIAAELAAAASGSAATGALGMLAFGMGTAPLLLVFGTSATLIPRRFKERLNLVLALAVLVWGIAFFNRGAVLLGSPISLDTVQAAVMYESPRASAAGYATGADGVVEVPFEILNDKYVPESVSIPANVPVRLMVKRQKGDCAHGGMCAEEIVIRQLGVDAHLAPLKTTAVNLKPTPQGTYTMSSPCGMVSGKIVAQ